MENLKRGLIPNADTEMVYSPNKDLKLIGMIICNIGGNDGETVDVYITSAAVGAVTTADAIMYQYPIDGGYNYEVPDKVLPKGCRLIANASAASEFSMSIDAEEI